MAPAAPVSLRPRLLRPIAAEASSEVTAGAVEIDGRDLRWVRVGDRDRPATIGTGEAIAITRTIDDAARAGCPVVLEVAGATVPALDGLIGLGAAGSIARAMARASGVVPVVVILDGPLVTGLALALGLCDAVVMTDEAIAYISGPAAVRTTTGRDTDPVNLGGPAVHGSRSGVAHLRVPDLESAIAVTIDLLAHLPSNYLDPPPQVLCLDDPSRPATRAAGIVPTDPRRAYDVREVIADVVDDGELLEISSAFGPAIVCGLARLNGVSVGIVANQPAHLAGAIDIPSSQKAARFVQWLDALGLPIVTFVDTPGYLPGRDLEWEGIIRFGGQLAFAYAAATTPRMCVILRKAYGGAYIVMDCKTMGNDLCLAWTNAEIAVMGASGAVQILHAKRLGALDPHEAEAERARLEQDYALTHLNPTEAARRGFVDAVVEPSDTRAALTAALPSLLSKRPLLVDRKHHNSPL
jgi:propionyl-CoA carboxylase beta chain